MRILDRYTTREFVSGYVFCLLAFISFYTVVDLFGHLNRYISAKVPLSTIAEYYLVSIPSVAVQMSPLAVALALLYRMGHLSRTNEITAIRSNGVSPRRISIPLLGVTVLISALVLVANEWSVPRTARKAHELKQREVNRVIEPDIEREVRFYAPRSRLMFDIAEANKRTGELQNIEIVENSSPGTPSWRLYAKKGQWDRGKKVFEHVTFIKGTERSSWDPLISANRLVIDSNGWEFFRANESRILPGEQRPPVPHVRLKLDQPPIRETLDELLQRRTLSRHRSAYQLWQDIKDLRSTGYNPMREIAEFHSKISFPLTNFVLALLALPLALRWRRSGLLMSFAIAVALGLSYHLVITAGTVMGEHGIVPPQLGPWLGHALYACAAVIVSGRFLK